MPAFYFASAMNLNVEKKERSLTGAGLELQQKSNLNKTGASGTGEYILHTESTPQEQSYRNKRRDKVGKSIKEIKVNFCVNKLHHRDIKTESPLRNILLGSLAN